MASTVGSSGVDWYANFKPNGGKEMWELGIQENRSHLGVLLKESGVESLWVVDRDAEDRLALVRCEIDASRSPEDSRGLVFGLACGDGSHRLLKRVLGLGAHPDLPAVGGERPSHAASFHMRPACVEALSLCRPDVSAEAGRGGCTPLVYAQLVLPPADETKRRYKTRILEVWNGVAKNGFPTVAQLAYQMDFWAVKNLCRRRVVPAFEVPQLFKGKDVFQWAEHHGELKLVEELRYLLQLPDSVITRQPSDAEPTVECPPSKEAGQPSSSGVADVVPIGGETKEFEEMKKIVALAVNSTVEEKLAKMREDQEEMISRRLKEFGRGQEAKTQEIWVAFNEVAAKLHSLEQKLDGIRTIPEDVNGEQQPAEMKATTNEEELRQVFSGLVAKMEAIAAAGLSRDLVDDLSALVKKHETGDQTRNHVGEVEQRREEEEPGNEGETNLESEGGGSGRGDLESPGAPSAAHLNQPVPHVESPVSEDPIERNEGKMADGEGEEKESSSQADDASIGGDRKTSSPAAAAVAVSHLGRLKYKEGQFRPDFPRGRRVYDDRDFLLALKECPHALRFPRHLFAGRSVKVQRSGTSDDDGDEPRRRRRAGVVAASGMPGGFFGAGGVYDFLIAPPCAGAGGGGISHPERKSESRDGADVAAVRQIGQMVDVAPVVPGQRGGVRAQPRSLSGPQHKRLKPFTSSNLERADPQAQKHILGARLFASVRGMHRELSGKITGMLLRADNAELQHMLENRESLEAKVKEAAAVLRASKTVSRTPV